MVKTPVPRVEWPKLKFRDWVANRLESGSSLTAKGSSKDSSISWMLNEPLRLKGGLFQSNSICSIFLDLQCNYFVFTSVQPRSQTTKVGYLWGLEPNRWLKTLTGRNRRNGARGTA